MYPVFLVNRKSVNCDKCYIHLWLICYSFLTKFVPFNCDPCLDGKFDSITCGQNSRLYITEGNHLFKGSCDHYPFVIDPEMDLIHPQRVEIVASIVDQYDYVYFFEVLIILVYS